MGGHQVPAQGPNDDGFDEDGYDESQRAEIIEATNDAPSDGNILTDIPIDLGDDGDEDDSDDLNMVDDELGEEDDDPSRTNAPNPRMRSRTISTRTSSTMTTIWTTPTRIRSSLDLRPGAADHAAP
jgi:hypothetical protein